MGRQQRLLAAESDPQIEQDLRWVIAEIDRKRAVTVKPEPVEQWGSAKPTSPMREPMAFTPAGPRPPMTATIPSVRPMPQLETWANIKLEPISEVDCEPHKLGFFDSSDPDYEVSSNTGFRASKRMRSVLAKRKIAKPPSLYGPGRRKAIICTTAGCTRVRDTADDNTTFQEWTFAKCPSHQREAWTLSKRKSKQPKRDREGSL